MSKIKAFAAVLKFINGRNDGVDSLKDVCDYTTDTAKTNGGTLVATQGCSLEHPVDDMLTNKRLHNKTHGKQYEHFVLAPCPNGSDKSPEDVLKVIKEIVAKAFPDRMAVISVHTDSKYLHGHVVLDAVNPVTGRKSSQGPADLNRIKQQANNTLVENGFEIITASANDFVDHTDYSNEEGFDFLELDESQFITESDIEEISAFTGSVSLTNASDLFCGWDPPSCNNTQYYGGIIMSNANYTPFMPQAQAMSEPTPTVESVSSTLPAINQTQDVTVPTTTYEAAPAVVNSTANGYPSTNVVTGPTFRIKGTPDSNFAGLNELVEQTTSYAQEHQRESANLAMAMQQYSQQRGYPTNVSVYSGPIFDIYLTGGMYPPIPGDDDNKF